MIRILEFRERIVMRRGLDSGVINANLFQRRKIVIHDHPLRAHHRHLSYFSGIQPTALDERGSVLPKGQTDVCHIFDSWSDMSLAPTVNADRQILQDMQYDRKVVRRQVPGHVDVLLEKAQVKTTRTDVANLANVPRIDNFLYFPHGSRLRK